ncbi:SDR family NAD(P)-dependent oxidoreductase [Wohlfahrtiimonas larvae]|uniref:(S)-benzoin forming benzil reductase n=1 Tax=Wohlfahrtiimonas larvae TaxID=1157986 RepID=A0ABP9ML98_9GAMM|nr:SDR family NAD(P)-dependent oxidoreductase [Wohlfahrtiimonas larvae]
MKALYIITGASKGIGEALANQLEQDSNNEVLRLARTNPNALPNLITVDLTDETASVKVMTDWLKPRLEIAKSVTLINNAGTVEPMGIVGKINASQLLQALMLNVGVVIALTSAFVTLTDNFDGQKFVMNISSGAGRNAYEGWGVYCATKAAVDRFTEVLMKEQSIKANPVKVTSIAPGIIDTGMQSIIRSHSEEYFPNVDRFIDYKNTGKLSSPEATAAALINYLHSEKMGTFAITDIRD